MKQATAYEGISHFAAQIIDLALLAAIVKENKTLSKRASKRVKYGAKHDGKTTV